MLASLAAFACLSVGLARAHQAAWVNGMYCKNGASNVDNENTELVVTPLYQLSQAEWWFHNNTACLAYPPTDGEILELPAGSSFTVEIATNRAYTTLSYGGEYMSDWPDGSTYPDDYDVPTCITSPNLHTQNQSMAAGTAFAISYTSDINEVTPENLVVFSVTPNTPWKRVTTYEVPAAMPPCPDGGCICGWGWIPNGCGQANMYHQAFKCNVTGATGTVAVGTPQPPVWCEEDQSQCVQGPKQMLYWNQLEGNNIEVSGYDLSGEAKSPGYNIKCGFSSGAQNDIFTGETISFSSSVVNSTSSVYESSSTSSLASSSSYVASSSHAAPSTSSSLAVYEYASPQSSSAEIATSTSASWAESSTYVLPSTVSTTADAVASATYSYISSSTTAIAPTGTAFNDNEVETSVPSTSPTTLPAPVSASAICRKRKRSKSKSDLSRRAGSLLREYHERRRRVKEF